MRVTSQFDSGQNAYPKTNAHVSSHIGLSFFVSLFPYIQVPPLITRPRRKIIANDQGSEFRAYVALT